MRLICNIPRRYLCRGDLVPIKSCPSVFARREIHLNIAWTERRITATTRVAVVTLSRDIPIFGTARSS